MQRLRLALLGALAVVLTVGGVAVARPFDVDLASVAGLGTTLPPVTSAAPSPSATPAPGSPTATTATTVPKPAATAQTTAPATSRAVTGSTSVARTSAAAASLSLRLVTYNTLGSLHTEPGGDQQSLLPAELRSQLGADFLRTQQPDVVGFQELRPNQIAVFQREFPGFGFWPNLAIGSTGRPMTMMWNDAKFSKVSSGYITIPYFGETRRASYVLLQHRATGRQFYYFNVHNSPGARQSERDRDLVLETDKINQLRATGVPVFFGGDLNERESAFCTVVAKTDLESASGGTYANGVCTPPSRPRLDWIFGSATFSNYVMLQPPLVQRATDHWIVAATATLN